MKPSEVKQYLFKVTFKNIDKEQKPLVVGKLDISWRNSFGEFGHLQTHPLSQPVSLTSLQGRVWIQTCNHENYLFQQDIYTLSQSEIKLKTVGNLSEFVIDESSDIEFHIINTRYLDLELFSERLFRERKLIGHLMTRF